MKASGSGVFRSLRSFNYRVWIGGAFVSKAFQGGETQSVLKILKAHFADVRHVKPKASRAESSEVYLVATGYRGK